MHFSMGAQHALVHRVDLWILAQEVSPKAAFKVTSEVLSPLIGRLMAQALQFERRLDRERPRHHLVVGAGREVDEAKGGVATRVLADRDEGKPIAVGFDGFKEPLYPALLPGMLVGARPAPELLT